LAEPDPRPQDAQGYTYRVVDLGGAGEGWIKALPVHLSDEFKTDLIGHFAMKIAPGKSTSCFAAGMYRERRCRQVKELFRMII